MTVIDWMLFISLVVCAACALVFRIRVIVNSTAPLMTRLTLPLLPQNTLNEVGRECQRRLLVTAAVLLVLCIVVIIRQNGE
jgi:hypothetical protein